MLALQHCISTATAAASGGLLTSMLDECGSVKQQELWSLLVKAGLCLHCYVHYDKVMNKTACLMMLVNHKLHQGQRLLHIPVACFDPLSSLMDAAEPDLLANVAVAVMADAQGTAWPDVLPVVLEVLAPAWL